MKRLFSFAAAAILVVILPAQCLSAAAPAKARKAVIGYVFPRKVLISDLDVRGDLLTHVNFAFANIKNGVIVAERPDDGTNLAALTGLRMKFPALKVLVSVGGWSWSGGFSDMAADRG